MTTVRSNNPANISATSGTVVVTSTAVSRATALALAQSLGLVYHDSPPAEHLHLIPDETGLALYDPDDGARLRVDFTAEELQRYRSGGSGRNPLRRAIGPAPRRVVDATAGLGRDSVHFVMLGYQVDAIERHPIVSALAQDGILRAKASRLLPANNPRWHTGDARLLLPALNAPADTVYIDPMFPAKRKKSAAVRKEMRLLRALVADDQDAAELLTIARACATDRVVVKRPDDAPPLAPNPTASYHGKLVRYDVYRSVTRD